MYSMVLLASLTTAGDTPSFGKKASGGCTGAPVAACAPVVVAAPAGCYGSAPAKAPRAGFLGLCKKKKEGTGCTGAVAPVPCCAPVAVVAVAPPPPAPVVVMAAPAGCFGSVSTGCVGTAPKAGFLGLCKKKKESAGCYGR